MKDNAKIIIGPVSVLSVVGKIYEKAMYKHLCGYLYCHNILYSLQFGFRQKWGGGGGGGWGGPGPRRGGSFVNVHKLGRVKPVLFPAGGRSQFFLARKNLLHVAQLTLIC